MSSFAIILIKSVYGKNLKIGVLILFVVIFTLGLISSFINIALPFKFAQDLTLTIESLTLHASSLLLTYKIVDNRKTARFAIACGLSRKDYITSIFLAIFGVCAALSVIFSVVNAVLALIFWRILGLELTIQLWLFCVSATLFGGVFAAIAFFTKPFSAFIYAIVLFFAGSASSAIFEIMQDGKLSETLAKILFWTIPNFEIFNMLGAITSGANFNFFTQSAATGLYFILYYGVMFTLSYLAFKNKPL